MSLPLRLNWETPLEPHFEHAQIRRPVALRAHCGDVRSAHEATTAVAGAKNITTVGAGGLAGQSLHAGLLDELTVQIGSLTLAWGKTLFPRHPT